MDDHSLLIIGKNCIRLAKTDSCALDCSPGFGSGSLWGGLRGTSGSTQKCLCSLSAFQLFNCRLGLNSRNVLISSLKSLLDFDMPSSTIIIAVACRGGADGATTPGIQPEVGIQWPSFVKKKYGKWTKVVRHFGRQIEHKFSGKIWDLPCPGHFRTSLAPCIQEPLHATEL